MHSLMAETGCIFDDMALKTGYFFNPSSLQLDLGPDIPESPRRLAAINERIAESCCGRIVSVLESGYDAAGSAAAVETHMKSLARLRSPSSTLLSTEKPSW